MAAFRHCGVLACLGLLCAVPLRLGASAHERAATEPKDPWAAAVAGRQAFEAEPAHTRAEYARTEDAFRAIYHSNPADVHAARAAEQVAELLAEQGRELGDRKSLRDAAGQFEFVAHAYPGGTRAADSLAHAIDLLGPHALNDPAAAAELRAELTSEYPDSSAAHSLRPVLPPAKPVAMRGAARASIEAATSVPHDGAHDGSDRSPDTSRDPPVPSHPVPAERLEAEPAEPVRSAVVDLPRSATHTRPEVTGIRHWSTSTYTRVAIDLGGEVEYQAARVENPDRIFFDLHHAHLAPQLAGKSFTVTDDGFLTRIRAAQYSDDVTRVVLDVHQAADYSAFLLPNPYRLIIDIHAKPEAGSGDERAGVEHPPQERKTRDEEPSSAATNGPPQPEPRASLPTRAPEAERSAPSSGASGLPPMPVTDGSSAGFGLPPRSATVSTVAAAAPRVVIPARSTSSRPVPNSVTIHSADTPSEVAEVSRQPGKVEANSVPTAQPIVSASDAGSAAAVETPNASPAETMDRGEAAGKAAHYRKPAHPSARASLQPAGAHVAGTPADPAPPTADGETLLRALGLKIGRIVIDAGHGGHDSGTLGPGGIEEKDVVLDVALRLGKLLHERLGAEIVYTRADDTFIPLETRTAIANKAQADLFISVHANSSPDDSARGVEVYYLNFTSDPEAMRVAARENAVSTQSVHELSDLVKKIALKDKIDESRELAADVDHSLYAGLAKGNDGLRDRGVKKAPFVVLIGANMPSILAEISFVTNPTDADKLEQPAYRERVAESLYAGAARYASSINGAHPRSPATERAQR